MKSRKRIPLGRPSLPVWIPATVKLPLGGIRWTVPKVTGCISVQVPGLYWFNAGLGKVAKEFFSASALAEDGYFTRDGLLSVLDDHRQKGINHSHRLWILLNIEVW